MQSKNYYHLTGLQNAGNFKISLFYEMMPDPLATQLFEKVKDLNVFFLLFFFSSFQITLIFSASQK